MKEFITSVSDEGNIRMIENELKLQELIRCKDCKWHSEKGFCKHPNGGAGNVRPVDWFCADGERKEGEVKMSIEEASVNINSRNLIIAIKSAIVCTNTKDTYSAGFRNGLRYVISLLTDEEPKYEKPKCGALQKEQEPVKPRLAASKSCYDHCGVCNRLLPVYRGQRSNFCPGCGKPVKWDE